MLVKEQLESLVSRNGIDLIELEKKLYNTLLLSVFEAICLKMKDPIIKQRVLSLFHREQNYVGLVKKISLDLTGCLLIENECELILSWLIAYFRKSGRRKVYSKAYKLEVLNKQNHICEICGKQIQYENSELDHIIPWDFVGDELNNNLQMLCSTCNEKKGSSVNYHLKMLLIKNNVKRIS